MSVMTGRELLNRGVLNRRDSSFQTTAVPLLVSTFKVTLPNVANFKPYYYEYISCLFPLTKGHLSNVAIISWQIGWPY